MMMMAMMMIGNIYMRKHTCIGCNIVQNWVETKLLHTFIVNVRLNLLYSGDSSSLDPFIAKTSAILVKYMNFELHILEADFGSVLILHFCLMCVYPLMFSSNELYDISDVICLLDFLLPAFAQYSASVQRWR